MRFRVMTLLAFALFCGAFALFSQDVIVPIMPSDGSAALMVNAQVAADTAGRGFRADRIYEFKRGEIYLQNATLTVPAGQTIRFRASAGEGPKPVIYLWPTGTGSNPTRPPGWSISLNGAHAEVKGICMTGIYEYEPTAADNMQGGLIQTQTAEGGSIVVDDCIFSNTNGNHIRTNTSTKKVIATNCIFANMGNLVTSNFGAGKAFDLRDVACDSFVVRNCTFVNYQDRPIRHWNATSTKPIIHGLIDHNTFVNGMGFHGLLSLGGVGKDMTITNNLFIDAFALGEDSTDVTRAAEWANTGEVYANGNNKITWIFTSPNDTTKWKVSNNYWTISDSGWAFLNAFKFGPANPLSAHIQNKLGAGAATAFTYLDLKPAKIPKLMTNLMRWYESPTGGNKTKDKANYVRARDDFDRRFIEFFRDTMDVSYPTSSVAYMGGENGMPAGDLNWFPDKKAQWQELAAATPIAEARIDANNDFIADLKGQIVTLVGTVTSPNYRPGGLQYYMQDATGGINIFASSVVYDLKVGDVIKITGKIDQYNGLVEIVPAAATDIVTLSRGAAVSPLPMTKADMNEATEGVLAMLFRYRLVDATKWPAAGKNATVQFTNGTDVVDVYIDKDVDIAGTTPPAGWVNLVGNIEQFTTATPANTGYEIRPRGVADFILITGVAENDGSLPTHYALSQNYPNPFNPVTTFAFDMPENGDVRIVVYDLLGKVVATLHDGKLAAGYHKFNFNGVSVPSGIYFYRVESKNFSDVKKMTLVK
ncbi:MAG TPA: T9SS type A sorting domain-containing protein [bacterium]|nr:T9SS type A sorting domain-containing protein [bacterium]HQI49912.1 T9SS type A sorting domain-containing protein [bacterium]HQJ65943.1 T9SS type A sorting domain-containing protein [bacterium]